MFICLFIFLKASFHFWCSPSEKDFATCSSKYRIRIVYSFETANITSKLQSCIALETFKGKRKSFFHIAGFHWNYYHSFFHSTHSHNGFWLKFQPDTNSSLCARKRDSFILTKELVLTRKPVFVGSQFDFWKWNRFERYCCYFNLKLWILTDYASSINKTPIH